MLQPEIGSALLVELIVDLAEAPEDVTDPRKTYIVSDETDGRSIAIARTTRFGTTWLLEGSRSEQRFASTLMRPGESRIEDE